MGRNVKKQIDPRHILGITIDPTLDDWEKRITATLIRGIRRRLWSKDLRDIEPVAKLVTRDHAFDRQLARVWQTVKIKPDSPSFDMTAWLEPEFDDTGTIISDIPTINFDIENLCSKKQKSELINYTPSKILSVKVIRLTFREAAN